MVLNYMCLKINQLTLMMDLGHSKYFFFGRKIIVYLTKKIRLWFFLNNSGP